jgi:hypothetical protein
VIGEFEFAACNQHKGIYDIFIKDKELEIDEI